MNNTAENNTKKEQNLKQIIKKLNSYMSFPSAQGEPKKNKKKNTGDIKNTWVDEQSIADFKW